MDLQGFAQEFGCLQPDGSLTVLHLREVSLGNARHPCQLGLREPGFAASTPQGMAWPRGSGKIGKGLPPGYRRRCGRDQAEGREEFDRGGMLGPGPKETELRDLVLNRGHFGVYRHR